MAKEKLKSYCPLKRSFHFKAPLIVPGTAQSLFPVAAQPTELTIEPAETAIYEHGKKNP